MKITDLLIKDAMIMDLKATTKQAAIDEMVEKLYQVGRISDVKTFKDGILAREAQTSTGLGDGIAIPHAKNAAVKEATVLFAKSQAGVDYEALDGQPTYLFFMIAAPDGANDTHLAALADLSKYLLKDGFADKLRQAKSADEVIATFDAAEDDNKADANQTTSPKEGQDFIVAVTACTTGIAHTYMAEESLKKVAAESYRVLKKDKFCAILMGDTRQKGHMIPMSFEVMKIFQDAGFKLKELIIKQQHNCRATGYWKTNSVKYNFLLIAHEYLFVFKK